MVENNQRMSLLFNNSNINHCHKNNYNFIDGLTKRRQDNNTLKKTWNSILFNSSKECIEKKRSEKEHKRNKSNLNLKHANDGGNNVA